jgi:hypothetical protein
MIVDLETMHEYDRAKNSEQWNHVETKFEMRREQLGVWFWNNEHRMHFVLVVVSYLVEGIHLHRPQAGGTGGIPRIGFLRTSHVPTMAISCL